MDENKKKEKELIEKMKYEIAQEVGLDEKIKKYGWKSLTSKESGKIGGIMAARKKNKKK